MDNKELESFVKLKYNYPDWEIPELLRVAIGHAYRNKLRVTDAKHLNKTQVELWEETALEYLIEYERR